MSYHPDRKADVLGIDNRTINSIPVVTDGREVETTMGTIIKISHQHACMGRGNSIHIPI